MIAPAIVDEVKRLLNKGKLSQRKVALRTGVSRTTVGAIASGKRPERRPRRADGDEFPSHTGPPTRCPECGYRVYMPCLVCRARAARAQLTDVAIVRLLRAQDEPLGLDLSLEDRQRYLAVHENKLAQLRARAECRVDPSDDDEDFWGAADEADTPEGDLDACCSR
jgi:hypothetical protein